MLAILASSLVLTAAAAPRLLLEHQGESLLMARPDAARLEELISGSTFTGHHGDGEETSQLRAVHARAIGDLEVDQAWRAWTRLGEFHDCVVSDFFLEVSDYAAGSQVSDELPRTDPAAFQFFARLRCEAADARPALVVGVDDPIPLYLELLSGDQAAAARTVDQALGPGFAQRPELADWAGRIAGREVHRSRDIGRGHTRAGHLLVERGSCFTGGGDIECGGEDISLPYVIVVRDGPAPELLAVAALDQGQQVRALVDIDADGMPELIVTDTFGTWLWLQRLDGTVLDSRPEIWWNFCPC